jgi:hypothetical protein
VTAGWQPANMRSETPSTELTQGIDSSAEEFVGALDPATDNLDIVELPGGGYVLDGCLGPEATAAFLRLLAAVIEQQEAVRRRAGRRGPPSGWSLDCAANPPSTPRAALVGRNAPCPCGSGRKHKRCCGA